MTVSVELGNNLHSAFDGQVVFETEPFLTPMVLITIERIQKAVSNNDFGEMEQLFFTDFQEFMARTVNIHFALQENAPVNLLRLRYFWEQTGSRDYPALWEMFVRNYDSGEVRREWQAALDSTVPPELAAAPELAIALGEDSDDLPDDSPLSSPGPTSIVKRSRSSKAKENPEIAPTP